MALPPDALRRVSDIVFGACVIVLVATGVLGTLELDSPHPEGNLIFALGFLFLADALIFAVVGVLITHRQPRNKIGWLLLAVAVAWSLSLAVGVYADYGVHVHPGSLPAPVLVYAWFLWTWVPAVGLMAIFIPLLFPDGHLPSPRWRWFAWLAAAVMVIVALGSLLDPEAFDGSTLAERTNPLGVDRPLLRTGLETLFVLFPLCIVASAVAAVRRYRRATGVERLQLKWLVTAGAFFAAFFGSTLLGALLIPWVAPDLYDSKVFDDAFNLVAPIAIAFFPLAIGAAILRYRLYDIDIVISRSLVFGALAVFITAVYVAVVVGIGRLVGSGDRPNLALSVAATAIVAVAFEPVRDQLQRLANRLVYGERATPYQVLSDFADRMGGAYDATQLLPLMASTVGQGVDASMSEVWLRREDGFELASTWTSADDPAESLSTSRVGLESIGGDRVVEVHDRGETLGAIAVGKAPGKEITPVEERLLATLATQAGPVLRNVRLIEDLRGSRQRLVARQDDERRRLERNLHDGAQQSLVAVALMLRLVQPKISGQDQRAGASLDRAAEELSRAIEELRDLARGIYPVVLTDRGLGAAVSSLAERLPIPVVVDDRLDSRFAPEVERALYFICFEALTSSTRAGAREAVVHLDASDGVLALRVDDDASAQDGQDRGLPLQNLLDRAAVVDANLETGDPMVDGLHLMCAVPMVSLAQTGEAGDRGVTAVAIGAGQ